MVCSINYSTGLKNSPLFSFSLLLWYRKILFINCFLQIITVIFIFNIDSHSSLFYRCESYFSIYSTLFGVSLWNVHKVLLDLLIENL